MQPTQMQVFGTLLFSLSILHTFVAIKIAKIADNFEDKSWQKTLFHYLGEVECVFAFWSLIFLVYLSIANGFDSAIQYVEQTNFTEPAFVFVIMFMASTKPIIRLAEIFIIHFSKVLPFDKKMSFYLTLLIFGPLLGSLITEPAAMTVCAVILLEKFYQQNMSTKFKYATLGLLFVNISIGGTLTNFAAPPVVMVASKFGWDNLFMLSNLGYKALISIFISTILYSFIFRRELIGDVSLAKPKEAGLEPKWWLITIHIVFLWVVILSMHHLSFFISILFLFLCMQHITQKYQYDIALKPALLVGIFLAGLILLGQQQSWWIQFLLTRISDTTLYFGATALTAVTDNAALTYLGSLVDLTDSAKYNLVAGSVTGGGLTVIANAPNPAGYSILKKAFPYEAVSPLNLLISALVPTIITILCFQLM